MTATASEQGTSSSAPSAAPDLPMDVVERTIAAAQQKPRRRWLLLIPILIVGGVAAWIGRDSLPFRQPEVTAITEAPEPNSVFALGRLEPEGRVIDVAGPSGSGDARIQELKVQIGDEVKLGQILAVLDNHDRLQSALQVAESKVQQSGRLLEQTRTSVRTTKAELQAALDSRDAQLRIAKLELERVQRLMKKRATTSQALDQARLGYETAVTSRREAESRLARYAESANSSVDVAVAESDVVVAEASLAETKSLLEQSHIRAPIAGTILDIDLQPGERINQESLLKIGRTDSMMVRAEVYESDVPRVAVDQKVTVSAPAFASSLTGRVENIATIVQKQSIVDALPAANTNARVVEVLVRLDAESNEAAAKFVEMQVRVEFHQ